MRVKVYFESLTTHAAEIDYADLVRLAEDADFEVPSQEELKTNPTVPLNAPKWSGADLSEYLWDHGHEVDSSETRVTEFEEVT
jgi:hypothetical protein